MWGKPTADANYVVMPEAPRGPLHRVTWQAQQRSRYC